MGRGAGPRTKLQQWGAVGQEGPGPDHLGDVGWCPVPNWTLYRRVGRQGWLRIYHSKLLGPPEAPVLRPRPLALHSSRCQCHVPALVSGL